MIRIYEIKLHGIIHSFFMKITESIYEDSYEGKTSIIENPTYTILRKVRKR